MHIFPMMVRGLAIAVVGLGLAACQQSSSPPPWASTLPGNVGAPAAVEPAVAERRIGLLVPLTGRIGAVGQDLARAAEMAILERGDDGVVLVTRDTRSTPEGAVLAARELLELGEVDVILGPLVGSHAERVAALARPKGVPVLSFSSQGDIAGDGLFVLGFRPSEQVRRVVGYATGRGFGRIAALAPDDAYGRQAVQGLRDALAVTPGAELVGVAFYGVDAIDAGARIQELRGGETGLPAFDALFIADGGQRLRQVSQLLPRYDVDPVDVRMLGTMLWQEDRSVLQEPALTGAWYAGVADATTRDFKGRFRRAFGRDAHPLAALGYDGLLVAAAATRDPLTIEAALTDPRGFQGEAGTIRILPTGVAEHGLSIIELTPGGPVVVEPAPLRFDGTS